MAGMGTTGTVNITPEMMDAAVKAISAYRSTTGTLYGNVKTEVTNLTAKDFTGSASTGFVKFYNANIEPASGKSLTDMLDALEKICNSIKSAIPDTEGVDEQLGTANSKE